MRPFARIRQIDKGRPRPGVSFIVEVLVVTEPKFIGQVSKRDYAPLTVILGSSDTGGKPEAMRYRDLLNEAHAKFLSGDIPERCK
jgi:hypothetical protein